LETAPTRFGRYSLPNSVLEPEIGAPATECASSPFGVISTGATRGFKILLSPHEFE
jgi:hypothetical protein